jgi:hypothetical protein
VLSSTPISLLKHFALHICIMRLPSVEIRSRKQSRLVENQSKSVEISRKLRSSYFLAEPLATWGVLIAGDCAGDGGGGAVGTMRPA